MKIQSYSVYCIFDDWTTGMLTEWPKCGDNRLNMHPSNGQIAIKNVTFNACLYGWNNLLITVWHYIARGHILNNMKRPRRFINIMIIVFSERRVSHVLSIHTQYTKDPCSYLHPWPVFLCDISRPICSWYRRGEIGDVNLSTARLDGRV